MMALCSWSVIGFALLGQLTTGLRLEVHFLSLKYSVPGGWLPQITVDSLRFDIERDRERSVHATAGDHTLDVSATVIGPGPQGFVARIRAQHAIQKQGEALPAVLDIDTSIGLRLGERGSLGGCYSASHSDDAPTVYEQTIISARLVRQQPP